MMIWSKLAWDARMLRDLSLLYPEERTRLAWSAVHLCVTAWQLRVWTEARLGRRTGWRQPRRALGQWHGTLQRTVPQQPFCEAIADHARLAFYRDGRWPDDLLRLVWTAPGPRLRGGWVLRHADPDGGQHDMPVLTLLRIAQDWRAVLKACGVAKRARPLAQNRPD